MRLDMSGMIKDDCKAHLVSSIKIELVGCDLGDGVPRKDSGGWTFISTRSDDEAGV